MSTHKSEYSLYDYVPAPPEPPEHPKSSRTVVLCFDGTGNEIDKDHTNVSQFFAMLKKDDRDKQLVYYQTGIGTYTERKLGPIMSAVSKVLDSMFGGGIDSHIKDGYEFLMQNYKVGDRICIFGFSRGAYTARALAAMIHKVGLLPRSNIRHIKYAFDTFLKIDDPEWKKAKEFKQSFCIDVEIHFVGIWDAVGSIGVGMPHLIFSNGNTTIKHFRHALSLDERRARFQANVWDTYENKKSGKPGGRFRPTGKKKKMLYWGTGHSSKEQDTDVKEVWFSGCHSDVGGGAVPNDTRHSLARISMRWMVRECFATETGIMFSTDCIKKLGIDPSSLHPKFQRPPALSTEGLAIKGAPKPCTPEAKTQAGEGPEPGPMSEEEEELYDALTPSYDQLELRPGWWLLELVPTMRWSVVNGDVVKTRRVNLGKPRTIADPNSSGVRVHRSVQMRMHARGIIQESNGRDDVQPYKPGAIVYNSIKPDWVA